MNTTVKYIKMCEEAKKIQELFKKERFGWVVDIPTGKEIVAKLTEQVYVNSRDDVIFIGKKPIWLPRQYQLQEMVAETSGFDGKRMIGLELCNFWAWYQQNRPGDIGIEIKLWPSWEQLWLKFVMKEKYNKLWDDKKEKWVE